MWQEGGRYPNVIVEILSDTTAAVDKGLKKQIYGEIFRTPEYFWFDPKTFDFRGFQLVGGEYLELQLNSQGWLWSQQLGLYLGVRSSKLRLFNPEGELVSIPDEIAKQERQLAEQERQQRKQVEQQVEVDRQQREQAEALLARYREEFGELPE